MKNFIFSLFAMFCMAITANAQYAVDGHRFFDNWSVGVNSGIQTNLHDWNAPQGAVVGVTIEKGITPVFSLDFEGQMGFNNVANWLHPNQMHAHNGTGVDQVNVFTYGKVNLMNWWGGYKGKPRLFEVLPFAGVGYQHNFGNSAQYNYNYKGSCYNSDGYIAYDNLLAKTGVELRFNLGKSKAWSVSARQSAVWNLTHNDGFDGRYAVSETVVGVAYHFGNSNGKHHFTNVVIPSPVEIIHEVPVEVVREVPVEVVKEVKSEVVAPHSENTTVTFAFNSSVLSDENKETLARIAKNHAEASVVAYASYEKETPANVNLRLSEERAKAVTKYLEGLGVKVTKSEGLGSVNEESNRIAIVYFE